ncbi:uncharacterized protein [Nicotiana tomentosiformis]|uniref:uncharacterized protein n=1 Tax=Nicotiana tomentosiformis TaxID=4098 RepID=UPI00388C5C0E
MDLAREKGIMLEDEKASANQVSITFGPFGPDELCSFKESKDESYWRTTRLKSISLMMMKNPVKHLKKAKVEVHHPQKPRHPVTLEEFLTNWFCTKIPHDGSEAFCCHAGKGKEKSDELPLAPSSEKLIESIPQEVNSCKENVMFTNDDLLLVDTPHNRLLYLVGYMRDERVNRILVDGGSSVNILLIRTVKKLGIPMNELSKSRVMIQGFNQGWQRAIGTIRLGITVEDMQLSAWLHMINANTSYNVLLRRPWIHENKGKVKKKIVSDDEPFTEAESHFPDAKFYLKNRIVKELKADDVMNDKNDESTTKRAEVDPNSNKSHGGNIVSYGKKVTYALRYVPKKNKEEGESAKLQTNMLRELTLLIKRIEAVKLPYMLLAGFVSQNHLQNVALPTKRTNKGFDPNAYTGYLQMLDIIPMNRQNKGSSRQKLLRGNHIKVWDTSNLRQPSIFDRLGKSTVRTSIFERLGPLKKGNKFQRNYQIIITSASPRIQKISKDFQSLVPSRMSQQTKLVVSCKEVLKVKPYIVVYCKERDEDEKSVGSSYHVTAQGENGVPSLMEDNEKLEDVLPCYHISFNDGNPQEDEDAKDALPELEEGMKNQRPTYLSALLAINEESTYIELLKKFKDVFAWSYKEMPGLDPKVAIHHLAIKNGTRLVKYEAMSFMDGSSSYNEIRMAPKDKELTAFLTPKGIYYYKVMPFGLKNVGATYQRDMQNKFYDLLDKNVECYVDDLVVKSRKRSDHLKDLRMVFEFLWRYQARMNPLKCSFGVTSGKSLGFIIQHRGIEIDQAKVDAILKMPEHRDIHELKSLQRNLAYLRRFISNLYGRCQPFSRLMKKGVPFKWDHACSNVFESIKT